jgi:GNAT superfamily N-acetyltransferase
VIHLQPVAVHDEPILASLLERERRWFSFNPPLDWYANGPRQWCWSVVAHRTVVGFAHLSLQENLAVPLLVARFAVGEAFRRRGHGLAILRALDAKAADDGLPLVAGVCAENAASLSLCRRFFGEPLYTGQDGERDVACFGTRAEALL